MRTAEHQYNVVPVQDTGALNRIESRTVRNKNIKICSTRGKEVAETKHGWEEKKMARWKELPPRREIVSALPHGYPS
jgi:hypothetical protein